MFSFFINQVVAKATT